MYQYEMHCHTSECSKCAVQSGAGQALFYKALGFDGLTITDHFLNGNTTIPQELPWEEKIERFMKGYEAAAAKGKEIGLKVFFGWECSYEGTDFLTYGLGKEWLLAHPDCDRLSVSKYCDLVHESGGFVVQAHPFREDWYIEMIRLLPRHVDAVETINAGRKDFENKAADVYADLYGLTKFAGTDNHAGFRPLISALELKTRADSLSDIIRAVKNRSHSIALYSVEGEPEGKYILTPCGIEK